MCSTPSKPVHCIVWAKQLFVLMFGKVEESMLYEDPVTGQSAFMDQVGLSVAFALSFVFVFSFPCLRFACLSLPAIVCCTGRGPCHRRVRLLEAHRFSRRFCFVGRFGVVGLCVLVCQIGPCRRIVRLHGAGRLFRRFRFVGLYAVR